jgi:8-oxo-dGTP diphosphatase
MGVANLGPMEPLLLESTLTAPGASFHQGVSALFFSEDRVLLAHRTHKRDWAPDTWDVPGGHVERGESETEALVREVREELGIEILQKSTVLSARLTGPNFEVAYFVVDTWAGEPYNSAPEEHIEIAWVPLSELDAIALADPEIIPIIRNAGKSVA